MQELGRYTKRETIEIHSRYFSPIAGGFLALVALVFTLGVLVGSKRPSAPQCPVVDPLTALDVRAKEPPVPERPAVPLTFHETLSPRAAVAAPVTGLPADGELEEALAGGPTHRARVEEEASLEEVPGEEPGIYTLQVGSFQSAEEASAMVSRLGKAGYRAFLVAVTMPERGGRWYRVRVGPYETKKEAWASKIAFEQKVRIPAFVVKKKIGGAPSKAAILTRPGRAPQKG